MSTFLFDKTVFGPVKSRRLGISLGINLLSNTRKICNFNCIYCECGWTYNYGVNHELPKIEEVVSLLEKKLRLMIAQNRPLDVITFAGNGEPTLHPEFPAIIEQTIALRNCFFPLVKIAVLSNAALVHEKSIFDALNKIDLNILKLDSAIEETCWILNRTKGNFNLKEHIRKLKLFNGNFIIQTMFISGLIEGIAFDNTTNEEVETWLNIIKEIKPSQVMIYTIARHTPVDTIFKIPRKKLDEIADRVSSLGIKVSVSQ
jgi:wyosine [tRNA(Phe)-imidazoG37] synthetase (radical SAM superfamily)